MRQLVFIIAVVLLSATVIADDVNIKFLRDNYGTYETLQVEITANVNLTENIKTSNIKLKNKNDETKDVSINLIKLNKNSYFTSFDLPPEHGEYRFVLEGLKYIKDDQLVKSTFEKSFQISERKGMSVNPGIIYMELGPTDNPKLDFRLKNYNGQTVHIVLNTEGDFLSVNQNEFDIVQSRNFQVITNVKKDAKGGLTINYENYTYNIPVYLFKESTFESNETEEAKNITQKQPKIEFYDELNEVEIIDVDIEYGESLDGIIYFINSGETKLENIEIEVTEELKGIVFFEYLDGDLRQGEIGEINVTVNPNKDKTGVYEGELIISSKGSTDKMKFILDLKERSVDPEPTVIELKEPVKVDLTETETEEEESSWGLLIFSIILIVVLVMIFVFYKKSKQERKSFSDFISSLKR